MKKIKIFNFIGLFFIFVTQNLLAPFNIQAQLTVNPPGVTYQQLGNLCYKTITTERIKISTTLDTLTLTNIDKTLFISKEYTQSHKEYFNEKGFSTHDIKYIRHINVFPKWYYVSDLIRHDNTGTINFFTTYNKYFTGGWAGGVNHTSLYGNYFTDPRTGSKYYWQKHSQKSQLAYDLSNSSLVQFGFLYGKVFYFPNKTMVQQLISMGYTVIENSTKIIAYTSDIRITWDRTKKIIKKEIFEGSVLKYTIISSYKYNKELSVDIKTEVIEIIPDNFENGDCYEKVIKTNYSDYSKTCGPNLDFRTSDEDLVKTLKIEINPNPVEDVLNLKLVDNEEKAKVKIISVTGQLAFSLTINPQKQYYHDIDLSQLEKGVYFINVTQNDVKNVEKFIKL